MYKVPLFDDETLESYCARLAAANAKAAPDFCADMGLRFRDVIEGSDHAIRRLAELGDVPTARLRIAAVPKIGSGSWQVGCEIVPKGRYAKTRIRICPKCLADDDECIDRMPGTRRYMRRTWPLQLLDTCPRHHCTIADLGPAPLVSPRHHDVVDVFDALYEEIGEAVRKPTSRSPSDFEVFAIQRLDGVKAHGAILDHLPLDLAGHLCELIDAADLFGRKANIRDLDREALWSARQSGYLCLISGESGLHEFLDRMHLSLDNIRSDFGGKRIYGKLYESLVVRTDPEFDAVKNAIHKYAFDVLPLDGEASVFGKSVETKFLSHSDILREFGISPMHLRKMAVSAGLLDSISIRSGSVPRSVATKIAGILNNAVLPAQAAEMLGISREVFSARRNAGLIKQVLASGHGVAAYDRYSRDDLLAFVDALKSSDPPPSTNGLAPIKSVASELGCRQAEIIVLMHSNALKAIGWDDTKVGLGGALVDADEVSAFVTLPDHGHLTARQLAKVWSMSDRTISALITHGALPTVKARNPRKRRMQDYVTDEAASDFSRKYVSFNAAYQATDLSRAKLNAILKDRNIVPVFPVERVQAQFYNRAELFAAISDALN